MNVKKAAGLLSTMGRGGDTLLAHINPREAALLKATGGSGAINPRTGLLEFDDGGGDGGGSANGGLGSGFGGLGGLSGFGSGTGSMGSTGGDSGGVGGLGSLSSSPGARGAEGFSGFGLGKLGGFAGLSSGSGPALLGGLSESGNTRGQGFGGYGLSTKAQEQAQALADVRDAIAARANAGEITGTQAYAAREAARLGQVGSLMGMGFGDEAAHLSRNFSPANTGLLSGLFSSMSPAEETQASVIGELQGQVQTPAYSLNQALKANHVTANADRTGYSVTPQGYAAALAVPAKAAIGLGVSALTGGLGLTGLAGLGAGMLGSGLANAAYDRATNNTTSMGDVSRTAQLGSTAAGLFGANGLAEGLKAGGLLAGNFGNMQSAMNIGAALEAGNGPRASSEQGTTAADGDAGSNFSDVAQGLGRQQIETAGLTIDPAAWFSTTRQRRAGLLG